MEGKLWRQPPSWNVFMVPRNICFWMIIPLKTNIAPKKGLFPLIFTRELLVFGGVVLLDVELQWSGIERAHGLNHMLGVRCGTFETKHPFFGKNQCRNSEPFKFEMPWKSKKPWNTWSHSKNTIIFSKEFTINNSRCHAYNLHAVGVWHVQRFNGLQDEEKPWELVDEPEDCRSPKLGSKAKGVNPGNAEGFYKTKPLEGPKETWSTW